MPAWLRRLFADTRTEEQKAHDALLCDALSQQHERGEYWRPRLADEKGRREAIRILEQHGRLPSPAGGLDTRFTL
jgi:hypothetical protein